MHASGRFLWSYSVPRSPFMSQKGAFYPSINANTENLREFMPPIKTLVIKKITLFVEYLCEKVGDSGVKWDISFYF